jgi:hypothetical protein
MSRHDFKATDSDLSDRLAPPTIKWGSFYPFAEIYRTKRGQLTHPAACNMSWDILFAFSPRVLCRDVTMRMYQNKLWNLKHKIGSDFRRQTKMFFFVRHSSRICVFFIFFSLLVLRHSWHLVSAWRKKTTTSGRIMATNFIFSLSLFPPLCKSQKVGARARERATRRHN